MARSVFLFPKDTSKQVERALFQKLQSDGLNTEGPFSDVSGSLEKIVCDVKGIIACSRGHGPIHSTMAALTPINTETHDHPQLDIPFILAETFPDSCKSETAGAIASFQPLEYYKKLVRLADPEELTLVGAGVLRRLGVECFFSYVYLDQRSPYKGTDYFSEAPSPALLIRDDIPQVLRLEPMEKIPLPMRSFNAVIEVLDDDALHSILRMKLAMLHCESLIKDISRRDTLFPAEWETRARDIGHVLHYGMDGWDLDDVRTSVRAMEKSCGYKLDSIRDIAEERFAQLIRDPLVQLDTAASVMLCPQLQSELREAVGEIIKEEYLDLNRLFDILPSHQRFERLKEYMVMAQHMNDHLHSSGDCEEIGPLD